MNQYESVIIINSSLEESKIKEIVVKFSELINVNGKLSSVEELGTKKLAYQIKKQTEGYYVILKFEANPSFVAELERIYRITDGVIKFIVIREEV
jgi:small subunit ribosomal protein S6